MWLKKEILESYLWLQKLKKTITILILNSLSFIILTLIFGYEINYLDYLINNGLLGDINQDDSINIQDIVLVVNLVLAGGYNNLADLNFDSTVDILDIIQIVNYILDSNW